MPIKIIKKILIIVSFYFVFGTLNAEENLKSIGKFKDWESFILTQDGNKVCFAQSIPVLQSPKKSDREARLFVTFRPSDKITDEVSTTSGYEFNVQNSITATSGKSKYEFDLPQGILDEEFHEIWHRLEHAKKDDKLDEDDKNLSDDQLKNRYKKIANRRVKLAILLQHIAKDANISVREKELSDGMTAYASKYPGQEKKIIQYWLIYLNQK